MAEYGLSGYDADVLVAERESAEFFEAIVRRPQDGRDPKIAANWIINELFGRLNREGAEIAASPVSAEQLGGILDLIAEETISGKIAKDVFEIIWSEGGGIRARLSKRAVSSRSPTSVRSSVQWTRLSPTIPTRPNKRRPSPQSSVGSSAK